MSMFWSLLKESIITQSVLTLVLWGSVVYLAVTNQPIPDLVAMGATSVLGFWFGTKVSYTKALNEKNSNNGGS